MTVAELWRPGCLGSSIVHSPSSATCIGCGFFGRCKALVRENTEIVGQRLNADILMNRMRLTTSTCEVTNVAAIMRSSVSKTTGLSGDQVKMLERVEARYSKSTRLAKFLIKNGVDLLEGLCRGENPYVGYRSHGYLHTVCEELLSGGFTRMTLKCAFVSAHDWSGSTANSTALVCIHALSEMGVIIEMNGKYVIGGEIERL